MEGRGLLSYLRNRGLSQSGNGSKKAPMQTRRFFYRVDRRQINFIRFIVEGYEGLAVVTTIDRSLGMIGIAVAPGCEEAVRTLISDLSQSILITAADPPVPEPTSFYA